MDELRRRTFLGLLSLPIVAAVLQSCSSDGDGDGGSSTDVIAAPTAQARSALSRVDATAIQASDATLALNDFGVRLYRQLAADDPTGNVIMSPASIATALTMAAGGAAGDTQTEMLSTLRVQNAATIHRSMNALTTQLQSLAKAADNVGVELSIANSLWGQTDVAFQPDFLDLLATEYGTGMDLVDFRAEPEGARAAINEWVDQQTGQRISDLLPPGSITTETTVALVNAIYLKAAWALPFIGGLTAPRPFTTAAGDTVDVPTMRRTAQFDYATGDGWQAVELPYANSSLAMLIFLPEPDFLQLFEEIFLVTDATAYLQPQQVQLAMPSFDIESKFSLADQLAHLGMPLAFDTDDADFSGMTTEVPLFLSAVVHQANISVGEEGTEAAAATAVVAVAGAAPSEVQPISLTIDRPFVFALRDRSTDTIVFLGRVGDPRG